MPQMHVGVRIAAHPDEMTDLKRVPYKPSARAMLMRPRP